MFDVGLTPLYAAITGKKWNTAKLVMGIAAAQYHHKNDDSAERVQAALFDLGMSPEMPVTLSLILCSS